jgi:DNA polymerase-3 subunit chi
VTDIAFHFGAPDKLAYVCRLLRKASATGARVLVVADSITLDRLDVDLWGVAATDFVPHCRYPADASLAARSPVALSDAADKLHSEFAVLLNMGENPPEGFAEFGRLIEVVSQDDLDRQQARQRWKAYTALGYTITRHDIAGRTTA